MPRESQPAKLARAQKIIAGLRQTYPDAHCELNFSTPLELLVATILSAQCTDKRVNLVTAALFKKYRSAADYAEADLRVLEQDIKSTGFYRNKAKNIQTCGRKLVALHGGTVPRTMAELTHLDGVGRKTANVVLGKRLQPQRRHRGGHARRAPFRAARPDHGDNAGENRTRLAAARAAPGLDAVQPLAHLAWPPPLRRAQAGLCPLRNQAALSGGRACENLIRRAGAGTEHARPGSGHVPLSLRRVEGLSSVAAC